MKKRLRAILLLCAAAALALDICLYGLEQFGTVAPTLSPDAAVHFIDVGQGDAALLLSGGQAVLIDAGTAESAASLIDYLESIGVRQLYAAVATHPHADHIGGMAAVLDRFPTAQFYSGAETASTAAYRKMLDALDAQQLRPTIPQDGDVLRFDSGASLTFFGPADDVPSTNTNDRSLITLFEAGGRRVLLMGDAESSAEQSLLLHHPTLRCDTLKVGHHGSDTSSSLPFLTAVQPDCAVISCGRDNDYGHPSKQTLENLMQAGITDVRITAQTGTVVLPLTPLTPEKENAA